MKDLASLLAYPDILIIREVLQILCVLAASENGKSALKTHENKIAPLLVDLLYSSDAKASRLSCSIFEQLSNFPFYIQAFTSSFPQKKKEREKENNTNSK